MVYCSKCNKNSFDSGDSSSVLAVVLNWNETELTLRCIRSLCAMKTVPDILIIDNYSNTDPSEKIRSEFSHVKIIRNNENCGVAGGRNKGIRFAIGNEYKYVLLFDNDAYADSDMLTNLVRAANLNPDTGILGPKILIDGKKNIIWRAGCMSWKWSYLHAGFAISDHISHTLNKTLPKFLDTMRGENRPDMGQYDEERYTAFQIGCAQLIRTEVFGQAGILDEEFSPYGSEDIDFCARVTKSGWKIKYIPKSICWHRIGSSFSHQYHRNFYNTRNLLLLARKNLNSLYFCLLFLPDFVLLTIPLYIGMTVYRKQFDKLKGFLYAIAWSIRDIKERGLLLK